MQWARQPKSNSLHNVQKILYVNEPNGFRHLLVARRETVGIHAQHQPSYDPLSEGGLGQGSNSRRTPSTSLVDSAQPVEGLALRHDDRPPIPPGPG